MIDCRKVRELLSDFIDDDLKEAVIRDLKKHLDDCPDCMIQVDSVRKVIRLYREATERDLPVDIRIRLHDVLRKAREQA
jgi:anti-sigma factor (TIGR02949 family)